ncbi:MAG TPA: hypothetical protein VN733_00625, partial [Solirubrobacterales bacterium]|nr:hypothetical protein [Solirubrobacterales bacterium]
MVPQPNNAARPRLAHAQLGYDYQDIVGASLLAVGLVEGLDYLATELPRDGDTFFDDLERRDAAGVLRWQVKHSTDPARELYLADLRSGGTLALKRMLAATGADPRTADQFRLLLTWSEPSDERLADLLIADREAAPSLPGAPSRCYRFNLDWIWPEGEEPNDLLDLPTGTERSSIEHLCESVVVELGAPTTSLILATPGDAETWLLSYLETSVGVSRPPNLLDPGVATDLLIRMAARGRPRSGAIGLDEVRQKLGLKSAFGRL